MAESRRVTVQGFDILKGHDDDVAWKSAGRLPGTPFGLNVRCLFLRDGLHD